MTEASYEESFAGGAVTIRLEVVATNTVDITVRHDGTDLDTRRYQQVFDSGQYPRQQRATVANWIRDELSKDAETLNPDAIREDVHDWLQELKKQLDDVHLVGPDAKEIIEGTHTPVEIRPAPDENTTLHVTLDFRGQTGDLQFDVGVLVNDAAGELMNKIAHNFYGERAEITSDDWEAIADYWADNKEVTAEVEQSGQDVIAERFLDFLADSIQPTPNRDGIENSPRTAWVDSDGEGATSTRLDIEPGVPVVWVTDDFFIDQMEAVSLSLADKSELVKKLKSSGVLHGQIRPRSWTDNGRLRVWAFKPAAVGIDPDDSHPGSEAATSEVKP